MHASPALQPTQEFQFVPVLAADTPQGEAGRPESPHRRIPQVASRSTGLIPNLPASGDDAPCTRQGSVPHLSGRPENGDGPATTLSPGLPPMLQSALEGDWNQLGRLIDEGSSIFERVRVEHPGLSAYRASLSTRASPLWHHPGEKLTPLQLALEAGHDECAALMLKHCKGQDPERRAHRLRELFATLVQRGQWGVAKALLAAAGNIDGWLNAKELMRGVCLASRRCNADAVDTLLKAAHDAPFKASEKLSVLACGLRYCSAHIGLEYLKSLKLDERSADLLLKRALKRDDLWLVGPLLQAGAGLDRQSGRRVLQAVLQSIERGDQHCAPELLDWCWHHGARREVLCSAAKHGRFELTRQMLGLLDPKRMQDQRAMVLALVAAVQGGQADCARLLTQFGAVPERYLSRDGETLCEQLIDSGNGKGLLVLIQIGGATTDEAMEAMLARADHAAIRLLQQGLQLDFPLTLEQRAAIAQGDHEASFDCLLSALMTGEDTAGRQRALASLLAAGLRMELAQCLQHEFERIRRALERPHDNDWTASPAQHRLAFACRLLDLEIDFDQAGSDSIDPFHWQRHRHEPEQGVVQAQASLVRAGAAAVIANACEPLAQALKLGSIRPLAKALRPLQKPSDGLNRRRMIDQALITVAGLPSVIAHAVGDSWVRVTSAGIANATTDTQQEGVLWRSSPGKLQRASRRPAGAIARAVSLAVQRQIHDRSVPPPPLQPWYRIVTSQILALCEEAVSGKPASTSTRIGLKVQ